MTHIQNALKLFLVFMLCFASVITAPPARAQRPDSPVIIRDTEIENTLREWMRPLLNAANMDEESVNLILVQSPDVNAFVAGGANIFIYTGLIDKTKDPGELIGVLAHELGHISGGHLVGTRDAFERASYESILGMVLGVGAALVTGNGAAANAIISGSRSIAGRRFMANSRINESSADQAALRFMEASGINPQGLAGFMDTLGNQELLPVDQQSEYTRSHPLTRNRIEALKTRIGNSPHIEKKLPAPWVRQHARMKAKLTGFINPGRVPWVYDDRDKSVPALYARAIAAYRQNKTDEALKGIDALIEREPDNPYFLEIKAQMLRDFGRVSAALPYYRQAVSMAPEAGLIRLDYGHALLESGDRDGRNEAIGQLERALRDEPRSSRAHRLLATAYGRQGDAQKARLHLAEEALLQRRLSYARSQAEAVLEKAGADSPAAVQARDIIAQAEHLEKYQSED